MVSRTNTCTSLAARSRLSSKKPSRRRCFRALEPDLRGDRAGPKQTGRASETKEARLARCAVTTAVALLNILIAKLSKAVCF